MATELFHGSNCSAPSAQVPLRAVRMGGAALQPEEDAPLKPNGRESGPSKTLGVSEPQSSNEVLRSTEVAKVNLIFDLGDSDPILTPPLFSELL